MIYFVTSLSSTASQKNPGEVQPLPGRGQSEQASCRSLLYSPPDISADCHSGLLHNSTFHDGVRLEHYLLLLLLLINQELGCLFFHIQNMPMFDYCKVHSSFPFIQGINIIISLYLNLSASACESPLLLACLENLSQLTLPFFFLPEEVIISSGLFP